MPTALGALPSVHGELASLFGIVWETRVDIRRFTWK
jgi:hypothetical protein